MSTRIFTREPEPKGCEHLQGAFVTFSPFLNGVIHYPEQINTPISTKPYTHQEPDRKQSAGRPQNLKTCQDVEMNIKCEELYGYCGSKNYFGEGADERWEKRTDEMSESNEEQEPLTPGWGAEQSDIMFEEEVVNVPQHVPQVPQHVSPYTNTPTPTALNRGFEYMKELTHSLSLDTQILDTAKEMYTQIQDKNSLKGRKMQVVVAATLFLAGKKHYAPILIKQLSNLIGYSFRVIAKSVKMIKETIHPYPTRNSAIGHIGPLCSKLCLSEHITKRARMILGRIEDSEILMGKKPGTIGGLGIYLASLLEGGAVDCRVIYRKCLISENAIKNAYRDCFPHRYTILRGLYDNARIHAMQDWPFCK